MSVMGQTEKIVGWRPVCLSQWRYISPALIICFVMLIPATGYALRDAPTRWLRELCGAGMEPPPQLESVSIEPSSATLGIGDLATFRAIGTLLDDSTRDITNVVSWTSSDESIGTITSQGQFTAIKEGRTTIRALVGEKEGTADVTVRPDPVASVSVEPSSETLDIGDRKNFRAIGTFPDGTTSDVTNNAIWSSSNESVGTITNQGRFTAERAGSTTIRAVVDGQDDTASVTVRPATLERLSVSPSSETLDIGDRKNFTARGTFSDGTTSDVTNDANWSSSNENVGTINNQGRFTAERAGSTTIRALLDGKDDTANVTVRDDDPTEEACRRQFGSAPDYLFCSGRSSSSRCGFAAETAGTCDAMCERFGSKCVDAYFNQEPNCVEDRRATCDNPEQSNICVCER